MRLLATHSIRQFPLHFPSRASRCATRFCTSSTHVTWVLTTLWSSPLFFLTAPHTCLCSQVDVLGPGVRDPLPAAADGSAFQTSLQHVWQFVRLHSGVLRQNDGRGADARAVPHDPLPRLGWRTSTLPLPDPGYDHVTSYARRCFLGHQVRHCTYSEVQGY